MKKAQFICAFFLFLSNNTFLNPLYNILSYVSAYFSIIPLIIGFYRFRSLKENEKIILLLVCFATLTEFVNLFYEYLSISRNISLLNIYSIAEALTISFFYYRFFESRNFRILTIVAGSLFLVVSVQQIITLDRDIMNHVSVTLESVMVTVFSVLTFHQLLQKSVYSNILNAPVFWINSAFLFYFTGTFFLHLFSNYLLMRSQYGFYELWGFWHSLVNILFLILISIGFWKTQTSQT